MNVSDYLFEDDKKNVPTFQQGKVLGSSPVCIGKTLRLMSSGYCRRMGAG